METKEIWRDITGYEGLYQISNLGNVKSLGNNKTRKDKVLKQIKNKSGYLHVNLCKKGKSKIHKTHRLVAQAFLPNPYNFTDVNHKDEVKTNNNVENLEWCTREYNNNYGSHNERSTKARSKKVQCIETGIVYKSTNEVERKLGFWHTNISKCCCGKRKTVSGFHWKYAD